MECAKIKSDWRLEEGNFFGCSVVHHPAMARQLNVLKEFWKIDPRLSHLRMHFLSSFVERWNDILELMVQTLTTFIIVAVGLSITSIHDHLIEIVILDFSLFSFISGVAVRSNMENTITVSYCGLIQLLATKARTALRDLDPTNDLTFLRIRSKKNEIMVAPGTDCRNCWMWQQCLSLAKFGQDWNISIFPSFFF